MANTQFTNVKVKWTPDGGAEVSTGALLDVTGLGSERSVTELKMLDDSVTLGVESKSYETVNFETPYDETAAGFMEIVQASYDDNKAGTLVIEFDNMPDAGTNGTMLSGTAFITVSKPTNNSKVLTNQFSAKWDGTVTRTKAA